MTNAHGMPHPLERGVRNVDRDPQPSEGQDPKDLGEDEGKDKDGNLEADTLDPEGHQATPGIDVGIEKPVGWAGFINPAATTYQERWVGEANPAYPLQPRKKPPFEGGFSV